MPYNSSTKTTLVQPSTTRRPISTTQQPGQFISEPYCYNCYQNTLSLVFVIDDTGSMSDDIRQVRTQAIDIVNKGYISQHSLANYILVTFNDPISYNTYFKTNDSAEIIKRLGRISVHGGGDCPEYAFTGLRKGIQNANTGSCVFLFTDADPKDMYLCSQIADLVKQKDIHLVVFMTGVCQRTLAAGMSSSCITTKQKPFVCNARTKRSVGDNVPSYGMFSGIGATIIAAPDKEITAPLKTILEKNMDIKYVYIASLITVNGVIEFPVDDYVEVLVIEIKGNVYKGDVVIKQQNNETHLFNGKDTINCMSNTCKASIMHPLPGIWTLINNRGQKWNVTFKGQGSGEVNVQLMERVSGSLLNLIGKPISGSNITLVATVSGFNETILLDDIILYSDNHTELVRMAVTSYPEFESIIAVADVIIPNQNFTISVAGHDENGIIERTSGQVISPIVANIEILNTDGILYVGMETTLSCIVTNYGAVNQSFLVSLDVTEKHIKINRRVTVSSDDSVKVIFDLQGDARFNVMTVTVSLLLPNRVLLQQRDLKFMVENQMPPVITQTNTSASCLPNSLNFVNCSSQEIEVLLSLDSSSNLTQVYTKPKTAVDMDALSSTTNKTHSIKIRGDCCIPKFRLFVKDSNDNLIQQYFDFTDGFTFVEEYQELPPDTVTPKTVKTRGVSRAIIYGAAGGGVGLLVVIGVTVAILMSKRKSSAENLYDNVKMAYKR